MEDDNTTRTWSNTWSDSVGDDDADSAAPVPHIRDIQLLDTLGKGGFGAVYRAIDERLGRTVALKTLHRIRDDEDRRRFLGEAVITGNLQHPHIVPVHGFGTDSGGDDYYTMPIVRGRTLADILDAVARKDPEVAAFTPARLMAVVVAVAEAVAYAHSRGVIHRDLKPQNIMIGSFGEVFVLDWGLAKVLGSGEGRGGRTEDSREDDGAAQAPITIDTVYTLDGTVAGTPGYMAPEQALGESEKICCATDVFALGVICFQCLTGERPLSHGEILVHSKEPVPDRKLLRGRRLPRALAAIICRALQSNPENRYPTAAELVGDLRAWLEDRPPSVLPDGPVRGCLRWLRHHPGPSAALITALIITVFAGYLFMGLHSHQQQERAALAEQLAEQERAHRLESERRALAYSSYLPGLDLLARAATNRSFVMRAEEIFRAALAIDDSLPEIHHALARVLRLDGRLDEAVASYQEAIRRQEALTGTFEVQLMRELGDLVLMDMADFHRAQPIYAQVVERDPTHPHARIAAAILASMEGEAERAIEDLSRLAEQEPDWWEIHHALGMIQFGAIPGGQITLSGGPQGSRDANAAVDALSRAIIANPGSDRLHLHRGLAHASLALQHQGRRQIELFEACLQDYDSAVRLGPLSLQNHTVRIQGLMAMANFEDQIGRRQAAVQRRQAALDAADVLVERWPHHPVALRHRGMALSPVQRLHELRPDLEAALQHDPDNQYLQDMLQRLPPAADQPGF